MLILREERKPFFEEGDKLVGHFIQLRDVLVGVDVTETSANRIIDEQKIGKLVPRSIVVFEIVLIFQAIGSDLHQGTILRTAAGAAIQPDDRPLSIGNMLILKVPEEEVSIRFWGDLNMSTERG